MNVLVTLIIIIIAALFFGVSIIGLIESILSRDPTKKFEVPDTVGWSFVLSIAFLIGLPMIVYILEVLG